jgi:hypothetical protein
MWFVTLSLWSYKPNDNIISDHIKQFCCSGDCGELCTKVDAHKGGRWGVKGDTCGLSPKKLVNKNAIKPQRVVPSPINFTALIYTAHYWQNTHWPFPWIFKPCASLCGIVLSTTGCYATCTTLKLKSCWTQIFRKISLLSNIS